MYPLKNWENLKRGYTFGSPTFYSTFHLGTDFTVPAGTPIFAPFDCFVTTSVGLEGGKTIYVTFKGLVMRCLHLSEFRKTGQVKAGEVIGISGNTGVSTGAHIHLDLSTAPFNLLPRSRFIDPETYNWLDNPTPPAQDTYMKYPLYQQKGQPGIYFKVGDRMVSIRNPQELKDNFGSNPKITQVDDVNAVATLYDIIERDNNTRRDQIASLEARLSACQAGHPASKIKTEVQAVLDNN